MKDVRYRLLDALVYDYPLIESWLSAQAAQGWYLEKTSNALWKFRRGEPKQVRYEVTYAPKASAYNSRPTEAEEDLAQLCADAGWVRVASMAQLQIFCNDDPDATPIETDEAQRLDNIRRTMNKHFFPQHLLMIGLFLLQFFMHLSTALSHPTRTLSSALMVSTLVMTMSTAILYGIMLLANWLWLRRARTAVESGQAIPPNSFYRRFRWVLWAAVGAYLLSLLGMGDGAVTGLVLGLSAASFLSVCGVMALCKRLNAPKWVNIVAPIVVTWVVMTLALTAFALNADRIAVEEELPHPDTLPLMLSDLGIEGEADATILEEGSSILASHGRYWDHGIDRISYTIVEVKCPLIYDLILNEQEQNFLRSSDYLTSIHESISEQSEAWDAHYVRHSATENGDRWLVCWEDRIVHLKASWQLTDEQIAQICEILNPKEGLT